MNMIAPRSHGIDVLRVGSLSVRLTSSAREVDAAQALRYAVFYEELGATADAETQASRRDRDRFDMFAAHLVVVDDTATDLPCGIVATYRLIDRDAAACLGGFYSAAEFDLEPLLAGGERLLELGRSCVHPRYRSGTVMQLLWRGLAEYVHANAIDILFGCASLPGTDPALVAEQLAYLRNTHLAPMAQRPRALPDRFVDMGGDGIPATDARQVFPGLPPLIKGYLRIGAWVGEGAVIDAQFNTIDVAIVLRTEQVKRCYLRHYARPNRKAA